MIEFKLAKYIDPKAAYRLFDNKWLCGYPLPIALTFNIGNKLIGTEFQQLLSSYAIKPEPTTVKIPMSKGIIDREHLKMGRILHGRTINADYAQEANSILKAVALTLRSTVIYHKHKWYLIRHDLKR